MALQATGAADLSLGDGFASVSVDTVGVAFNNTGEDIARTVSVAVGDAVVTAPLNVLKGQSGVVLFGLKATIGGFVTVSGDFGVQKTPAIGAAQEELVVVARNASARLRRGKETVHEGKIATLKRFKDDANEVRAGLECGIKLDDFNGYNVGDVIECYEVQKVRASL